MTEQELRDKMRLAIGRPNWEEIINYTNTTEEFDRITEAENGIIAEFFTLAKEAGYVKLAEDQKLPDIPSFVYANMEDRKLLQQGAINYSKMLSDWKKVKLEKPPEHLEVLEELE